MYLRTSLAATLDAITGISPEYRVKNRKQVLTRPDRMNGGVPTAPRGRGEAGSGGIKDTLARLPPRGDRAIRSGERQRHPPEGSHARRSESSLAGNGVAASAPAWQPPGTAPLQCRAVASGPRDRWPPRQGWQAGSPSATPLDWLSRNGHQAAVGQVGVGLLRRVVWELDAAEALLVAVAAAGEVVHRVAAVEVRDE
jgi:hypothetical protein